MLNCRICLTLRICTNYLKCKLFVITKHFWDVIRNIIVVLMQVFLHKIIRLQFTYRAIAINTIKVRAQNIVFYELYSVAAFYHRKINFQTYIIRLEKNNVQRISMKYFCNLLNISKQCIQGLIQMNSHTYHINKWSSIFCISPSILNCHARQKTARFLTYGTHKKLQNELFYVRH